MLSTLAYVGLGGAIGAIARFLIGIWVLFPYGTMAANILGGFLMGLLVGWLVTKDGGHNLRLFLGVGVLGGFTTFSAFSLDAWQIIEKGRYGTFAAYAGGSVVLSILALALGLILARQLFA